MTYGTDPFGWGARQLSERLAAPPARTSLLDFIPRTSPGMLPPDHLEPIVDALTRIANRQRVKACISCPPGSGKTNTIQHAIVWLWRTLPWLRVAYITYSQPQADVKSRDVRDIAERAGIELRADAKGVRQWITTAGGWFLATSVDGPLTGQHPHLVIYDDPYKSRIEAESVRRREVVWSHFTGVALGRGLAMNASYLVVHTRWHPEDLTGRLHEHDRTRGEWEFINLAAVGDEQHAPTDAPADPSNILLPQRQLSTGTLWGYAPDDLDATRAANEYDWWSIWQGTPRPRGGKVFREPHFYDALPTDSYRMVIACDPAGSAKTHANHTVAIAARVYGKHRAPTKPSGNGTVATGSDFIDPTLRVYVTDVARWQLLPEHYAPLLLEFQRKNGGALVGIEGSRDGHAAATNLRKLEPDLRIKMLTPRGDKFIRAQPAASLWNSGRFLLPPGQHVWMAPFLKVLSDFTGVGDERDDDADAVAWTAHMAIESPSLAGVRRAGTERWEGQGRGF